PTIRRLSNPTPGSPNAPWRVEPIVINEIMYNPLSGDSADEYVELFNRSGVAIDLSGWKFTDGIAFEFPKKTALSAGGYLVVAKNAARLLANYPELNSANAVGDYSGTLSNDGGPLALAKPA